MSKDYLVRTKTTFTIAYPTKDGLYSEVKVTKMLPLKSSIREEVIKILEILKTDDRNAYLDNLHEAIPISIYLQNSQAKNIKDAWRSTKSFGISYAVLPDESIKFLSNYEPLSYDWKLKDIKELVSLGYLKGDPHQLLIGIPDGLGGGGQDVFQWVGFISDAVALSTVGGIGIKRAWRFFTLYNVRCIAKQWSNRGLHYPEQLREFIDLKAEWSINEVCKRLKINQEFAIKLLTALGLEPVGNTWRLTQSNKSIKNRRAWIRNENKYKNLRNDDQVA